MTAVECEFYRFAHAPLQERGDALRKLRTLVEQGVRSPGWDLSRNVARAVQDGHPEAAWLPQLAAVINGDAQPEVLSEWPVWRDIA